MVNKRDDSESFRCQNALFASSFELLSFPIINSTEGSGYASLNTFSFKVTSHDECAF